MKLNKKNKGFTLIELLVVIAIIGLLSGIVLTSLENTRAKARNAERLTTINQIQKAMEIYATASGKNRLPATDTSFSASWYSLGAGAVSPGTSCPANQAMDNLLTPYMAGNKIPKNPNLTGCGAYYRYTQATDTRATPPATSYAFTTSSNCNLTTCPHGAYLIWTMEGTPAMASKNSCGSGVLHSVYTTSKTYICALRIGDRVRNN